jgi:hypothetical protein
VESVQMSSKVRHLRNLLDLGKGGLSTRAGDANFFEKLVIIEVWKSFDPEVDLQDNDSFNILKLSSLKSEESAKSHLFKIFSPCEVVEIFEVLVRSSVELITDIKEAKKCEKMLFQSMTNLLLSKKFTPSNFYLEKLIRLAFFRVPHGLTFAANFVKLNSHSMASLDESLETLAEMLWINNKIVLFSTWIIWFNLMMNKLCDSLRKSGEQSLRTSKQNNSLDEESQEI